MAKSTVTAGIGETGEAAPEKRGADRVVSPLLILAVPTWAQLVVILDATIVNVALPSIERDLGFGQSGGIVMAVGLGMTLVPLSIAAVAGLLPAGIVVALALIRVDKPRVAEAAAVPPAV